MHNEIMKWRSLWHSAKSQNIQQVVLRCIQLSILTPCSNLLVCVRDGFQSLILKILIDKYTL